MTGGRAQSQSQAQAVMSFMDRWQPLAAIDHSNAYCSQCIVPEDGTLQKKRRPGACFSPGRVIYD